MEGRPTTTPHRLLAVIAAVNAAAAWLGAVGLATGALSIGSDLEGRLPLGSSVLGGAALAALVAVPLSLLAAAAWTGDPRTPQAATAVGLVLVGWIAVQLLFLRQLNVLHPTYLVIGAVLAVWGRRIERVRPGPAVVA